MKINIPGKYYVFSDISTYPASQYFWNRLKAGSSDILEPYYQINGIDDNCLTYFKTDRNNNLCLKYYYFYYGYDIDHTSQKMTITLYSNQGYNWPIAIGEAYPYYEPQVINLYEVDGSGVSGYVAYGLSYNDFTSRFQTLMDNLPGSKYNTQKVKGSYLIVDCPSEEPTEDPEEIPIIVPATADVPNRPASIKHVETIVVNSSGETLGTDSSDSKGTLQTIYSDSLFFGPIAPGETSKTLIIYLKVPSSVAINNIKLGLIDSGTFDFDKTTFGVEIQPFIDYNIIPSDSFDGINTTKDPASIYNIDVGNRDLQNSNYVYLNIVVPRDQVFGSGTLRMMWFFDYA